MQFNVLEEGEQSETTIYLPVTSGGVEGVGGWEDSCDGSYYLSLVLGKCVFAEEQIPSCLNPANAWQRLSAVVSVTTLSTVNNVSSRRVFVHVW